MLLTFAFCIDKNVMQMYYYENVKLFCQNFIDIALERGRYIGQSKRHYLVLEIINIGPEGYFLFIAFSNPHFMVGNSHIKLGVMPSLT